MKINIFTLCDNAFFSEDKKLNIIGVFDRMTVEKTPIVVVKNSIAASIVEIEDKKLELKIVFQKDGDKPIKTINIALPVSDKGSANLVINIPALEINEYGKYMFKLISKEEEVASTNLYVEKESEIKKEIDK